MPSDEALAISALIPTHGRPEALKTSVESALSQTLRPVEIIVADDLGDAETAAMLAALREAGAPIQHVRNTTAPGASGSRNAAAAAAKGTLFAFLDDDDYWRPDYLATSAGRLWQSEADFAISGLLRLKADGEQQEIRFPSSLDRYELLSKNHGMTGSNLLIKRQAFEELGGFDSRLPVFNDWDFLIRLIVAGKTYIAIPELLVEWREHLGERISTPSLRRADGIDRFLDKHGSQMAHRQSAEIRATAIGIRRRHANTVPDRIKLALDLAIALGPSLALSRLVRRPARK